METSTSTSMAIANIQELTITLIIKNYNPSLLSYEFLTMTGIVPSDWELARQPISNPRTSQVAFKNGVNIVAQGNSLNFVEGLANKQLSQLQFAQIASQYIDKMPKAEYQGLSIAPKLIIPFPGDEGGKDFINNSFLKSGSWANIGNVSPQSSLSLFYNLDSCRLSLNINPAKLQQPNNVSISAVLFAGSFNYLLTDFTPEEMGSKIKERINNWQGDFNSFQKIVYQQFLQKAPPQEQTLFDT